MNIKLEINFHDAKEIFLKHSRFIILVTMLLLCNISAQNSKFGLMEANFENNSLPSGA